MFRFTKKPASGSNSQYLAKITGLVQCRYGRRTDVVSIMAAEYDLCGLCCLMCKRIRLHSFCVTSGFHCSVNGMCTVLGFCAMYNVGSLPTFRDNLSVKVPETSVIN
jgi:hypothetical protein